MKNYSLLRELKRQGKINDMFEAQMANLTLEDVIGLKLEIASKAVKGKLYGMPIYFAMPNISKDAVFKWAISTCNTKANAARLLGISLSNFNKVYKKLKIDKYFKESA